MKRESVKLPSAPTLAHFTRAAGKSSALDNLARILAGGLVRGSSRMLLGGQRGVCLFDAPADELAHLLTRENRRRYEPFGVAVDKRYAFSQGARPVIYMPTAEAADILDDWNNVKPPPRPELKAVTLEGATTALLILAFRAGPTGGISAAG